MKVLTIERSKWRRGGDGIAAHGNGPTMLLNGRGFMCCLGFDALACGLSADDIRGESRPADLYGLDDFEEYWRTRAKADTEDADSTSAVSEAIDANDDPDLSPAERERLVTEALMRLGWDEVRFVD